MTSLVVKVGTDGIVVVGHYDNAAEARRYSQPADHQHWEIENLDETLAAIKRHNEVIGKITGIPLQEPVKVPHIAESDRWDWNKVDEETRVSLVGLYEEKKWSEIMAIHNDLELTSEHYCCSRFIVKIEANIEKAIADGILKK